MIGKLGISHYDGLEAVVAICIAHVAHFMSVLVLHELTSTIFVGNASLALTAASLHIISPAGLFLSAPYAESSCALLSFSGCLLFAKSYGKESRSSLGGDLLVLCSGVLFGIATTIRSNGILNGLLLLEEATRVLLSLKDGLSFNTLRRLLATGVGGMAVGAGSLIPQYIAYIEYCGQPGIDDLRPWCRSMPPSIYTFVQDHYW